MSTRMVSCTVLCLSVAATDCLVADPVLEVSIGQINGQGNQEWRVQVAPDESLFLQTPDAFGGSLAVELAFELTSGSLEGAQNDSAWRDNPGNNPFTGSVSFGTVVDTAAGTVFASLGSDVLISDALIDVLTIETTGTGPTTLVWGPNMVIAQGGSQFRVERREISSGFGGISGDYSGNGLVEQADLDLVLGSWGVDAGSRPPSWINDLPVGFIDQQELDGVLGNWGRTADIATASVAEPSGMVLLVALATLAFGFRLAMNTCHRLRHLEVAASGLPRCRLMPRH